MKFAVGLLLGLALVSASADVFDDAARNGCTIVLRDGATVTNTSLYGLRIVTEPGAEDIDFAGNVVTFAGP